MADDLAKAAKTAMKAVMRAKRMTEGAAWEAEMEAPGSREEVQTATLNKTAVALEEVASVVVALAAAMAAATDETRAALTDEALAVEREIRD